MTEVVVLRFSFRLNGEFVVSFSLVDKNDAGG